MISDQSLFDVDGMTALHWSVHGNDTQALQVCVLLDESTDVINTVRIGFDKPGKFEVFGPQRKNSYAPGC